MRPRTRIQFKPLARRWAVYLLLPVLLLLGVRLLWGWQAHRRLAAVRAELQRQGMRLEAPPHLNIPDDQNAALAVIEALNALKLTPAEATLVNEGDHNGAFVEITWTDAHLAEMQGLLARQTPVFQAMENASQRPAVSWPTNTTDCFKGGIRVKDHPIFNVRQLANLLYDAAIIAHQDHDEAHTLKYLQGILVLANVVDQEATEISHVVASALRPLAAQGVERIAGDLRVRPGDGSQDAALRLLALLRNVPRESNVIILGWEREIADITVEPLPGIQAFWQWWFAPLLADETGRIKRIMLAEMPAVRADNWAQSNRLLPKHSYDIDSFLKASTQFISRGDAPSSWMYTKQHFRALSDCAAASLLLASALYQQQNGRYPAVAKDLVPEFLPDLPIDPYAADHRPMAYRLDPEGPTVWSVNENGTDEGGHVMLDAYGVRVQRHRWSSDTKTMPPDTVYGAAWTHAPTKRPVIPASTIPVGVVPKL